MHRLINFTRQTTLFFVGLFLMVNSPVLSQGWEVLHQVNGEIQLERNLRLLSIQDSLMWVGSGDYIGNQESPALALKRLEKQWSIPVKNVLSLKQVHIQSENPAATGALLGFLAAIPIGTLISQDKGGTQPGISGLINDVLYDNFLVFLVTTPLGAMLNYRAELRRAETSYYDLTDLTLPEKTATITRIIAES